MNYTRNQIASLVASASFLVGPVAMADVVTDWNIKAGEIVVEAKLGPPPANRVLAIVQTAVYAAVNAITKRYPASELQLEAASGASVEAAIAAANHATLAKLVPSQQAAIDTAYHAVLAGIADGPAKTAGIALGDKPRRRSSQDAPMTAPPRGRRIGRTPPRGSTCRRSSRQSRTGRSASRG
jgi:hypothetical protein